MKRKSSQTSPADLPEPPLTSAAEESAVVTELKDAVETIEAVANTAQEAVQEEVGNVMQKVEEVTAETVEQAEKAAARFLPAARKAVGKAVYGTFYYASFGVVFSALMVSHLVPMDNLMGRAIKDGASAARDAVQRGADIIAAETRGTDEPAAFNA